jgi:hypothetical protein
MILTWCANKQYMNTRFIHGVIVHILKSSANTCNDRFGISFLNPLFKHLSTKYLYRTGDVKYICIYFSKLRVYYITGNVIKLSVTSDRSMIFTRYYIFFTSSWYNKNKILIIYTITDSDYPPLVSSNSSYTLPFLFLQQWHYHIASNKSKTNLQYITLQVMW